ncbi:hypothetical protein [Bacillus sp. M6-12]|uniref:hypothetical protein n=1 Tax=Bacillus sp. M6-12 TaxID=2054166 RepID=UPI0011583BB4|nr:hypothetical protein [Bacillus sp. M6-12]
MNEKEKEDTGLNCKSDSWARLKQKGLKKPQNSEAFFEGLNVIFITGTDFLAFSAYQLLFHFAAKGPLL